MHRAEWIPTKNNRLCSKHFEKHFFYLSGVKTCLLNGAVPTIFPELPKHMQTVCQPKRVCSFQIILPSTLNVIVILPLLFYT